MRRAAFVVLAGVAAALGGCETTSQSGPGDVMASTPEEGRLAKLARDIEGRDPGTAAALYERAVETSGGSPAAYVRLGDAQARAGDVDAAKASYQAALGRDPKNAKALLGLGTVELKAGEAEPAARHLGEAAPQLNAASPYNRLGTALVLTGRPGPAKDAFLKARSLEPNNIDIQANVALAQALNGESQASVTAMRAVVATPGAGGRQKRNLVVVLSLAGLYSEAEAVSVPNMTPAQKAELLTRAKKLQTISDPTERAKAIGLMAGA